MAKSRVSQKKPSRAARTTFFLGIVHFLGPKKYALLVVFSKLDVKYWNRCNYEKQKLCEIKCVARRVSVGSRALC